MCQVSTFRLLGLLALAIFLSSSLSLMAQLSNDNWLNIEHLAMPAPAFALTQKSLLGMGIDDDLRPTRPPERDELGYTHHRYRQTYRGIPVEGATLLLHERNGMAYLANGALVRRLQADNNAALSPDQALQRALAHVNGQRYAWQDAQMESTIKELRKDAQATFYPSSELVWVAPLQAGKNAQAYRLAYKLDIYALQPLKRAYIYIDAQNGNVIDERQLLHDADVTATGNDAYSCSNPVNITADNAGSFYRLRETQRGGGIQTYTSQNTPIWSNIDIIDPDTHFNSDPTAVSAHRCTEATYDYFKNTCNRNSIDGNGYQLKSWVHYGTNYDNAFWNGVFMTYGDGGTLFTPLTSPDVVAHEITHGLTENTANLVYAYEPGALNESFSDIFGTVIEFEANAACADWIMGSDITLTANGLRSMSNPNDATMLTRCPDTYGGNFWNAGSSDNGGVHANSGVQNFWFYLLSNGGTGTNDNAYTYNVSGIGMDKAARIAYRNLCTYLNSTSNYAAARAGSIQAATDLYGAGSNEVSQVIAAWCAVGVGNCSASSNSLSLTAPNGGEVWLYNSNQNITWTTSGTVPTINIDYSIDGGATWNNIAANLSNTGSYAWTVPNVSTQQAKVRVSSALQPSLQDVSDAFFTIEGCDVVASFNTLGSVGFYSINTDNDKLVFIDTLGNASEIGYIGRDIISPHGGLTFSNDNTTLYLQSLDSLYTVNTQTGVATPLFRIYSSQDGTPRNGSISFKSDGTLFLYHERTGVSSGELYTVNMTTGAATALSGYNGYISILCIAFDNNDVLYGIDEWVERLLIFNTTTGLISYQYPNPAGISYMWSLGTDGNDDLWAIEIPQLGSPNAPSDFYTINKVTGISSYKFTLPNVYLGLAYGIRNIQPNLTICAPITLTFNNTSSGASSYVWSINGITEGTSTNLSYNFTTAGIYTVQLNATNGNCNDVYAQTITVNPAPDATFTHTENDLTTTLIATQSGATAYNWDFGDGSTGIGQNTAHTYAAAGTYNVCLTVVNGCGSVNTCQSVVVQENCIDDWQLYLNGDGSYTTLEDGDYIWVGTAGSGLVKLNKLTGEAIFFTTDNSDLTGNTVTAILKSSTGHIWVGAGTLCKFDGYSHTGWTIFNNVPTGYAGEDIEEDRNGNIWVSGGRKIWKYDGINWIFYDYTNSPLVYGAITTAIEEDYDGNIWIGMGWIGISGSTSGGGLAKLDSTNNWTIYNTSNSGLPGNFVYTLLKDSINGIWIGTHSWNAPGANGLAKFDGTTWTTYNTSNSDLPNNSILRITRSDNGNIWVGTGGGACVFGGNNPYGWTIYNSSNSDLNSNDVHTILEDNNGNMWFGTTSTKLAKLNGTSHTGFTYYETSNSDLGGRWVGSIMQDDNGDMLIGTNELGRFDGNSFYGWIQEVPYMIFCTIKESNGDIWAATSGAGLAQYDGYSWIYYNTSNSLIPSNVVSSVIQSSDGSIWVGTGSESGGGIQTGGGLAKFDGVNWTVFNTATSNIPSNTITDVIQSADGYIWVSTADGGFAKFNGINPYGFTVYNTSNSPLTDNRVNEIFQDSHDNIWLSVGPFWGNYIGGAAKFDGDSLNSWVLYTTQNSPLLSRAIRNILEDSQNNIWLATTNGLYKFDGNSTSGWDIYRRENSDISGNYLETVYESTNGDIWVGTYHEGLSVLRRCNITCTSPIPTVEWQNTIGGTDADDLHSIYQTNDGSYILGGHSKSGISGDKTDICRGEDDYWIMKLDNTGQNILWQKTIGGNGYDHLTKLLPLTDGSYIVIGESNSGISGEKTVPNQGGLDAWIVKLDPNGNIQWQKNIGGSGTDYLGIISTSDGGYIIGGTSNSNISGDKTENSQGGMDIWILKLDNLGNIQWQNTIGGSGDDNMTTIEQTPDGGFLLGGSSNSDISGDKTENSQGGIDIWVLKLDNLGNIQWQNTIGGSGTDYTGHFKQVNSGGYIVSGFSTSNASGDKTENSNGAFDYWIMKLDDLGNIQWQNTIGGSADDKTGEIIEEADGYLLSGTSFSPISGDKTTANKGGRDEWLVKIDFNGNIIWDYTIGGDSFDVLSVRPTSDNGYIVGGWSASNISGDKTENSHGSTDFWILKLAAAGTIPLASQFVPPTTTCSNTQTTFTNTSTGATNYQWLVDNTPVSTATNLIHTFSTAGTHTIKLIASNGTCTDIYTQNINISANAANLNLQDVAICGTSAVLDCGIPNALYYMWDFGGALVGTNQTLNATQSGTYTLSVADACGSVGFDSVEVLLDDDCVYPGDFNYDGIANNYDLLYWGWAAGSSGSARPNASFVWQGQPCADWVGTQHNGINYKHADGNGNGIIDNNDPQAIIANYGQTHGIAPTVGNTGSPLSIVPVVSQMPSAIGNNTLIYIDLYLNNDGNTSTTMYGTAFKANYLFPAAFNIRNAYLDFSGSWLGTDGIDMRTVQKNFVNANNNGGYIEVAVSRNNHQNATGSSKVATLIAEVDVVNSGSPIAAIISATNGQVSLANGNIMGISNSSNMSFSLSPTASATGLLLQPTVWLNGAYNSSTGLMNTALRNNNLLPLHQPYHAAPYNYTGTESVATLGNMPANAVDWVLVELRSADNMQQNIARKAALLLSNGSIVDADGISNGLRFPTTAAGNYYVVIRHRNHVDIISSSTISLGSGTPTSINLGDAATILGGTSQAILLGNGQYALKSGDFDGNGVIQVSDFNLFSGQTGSINQYRAADCNLDGHVTIADFNAYILNPSAVGVAAIRY